jgi:hypothetical protein
MRMSPSLVLVEPPFYFPQVAVRDRIQYREHVARGANADALKGRVLHVR